MSGWVKINQVYHIIFEIAKLCITLQCHGRYIFYTFVAKTLYDFYKRSPPQCKISDFWLLRWNLTKFYQISPLLLKVYQVSAKQSMEEICLMIPKNGAKFEEKLIFCFKNDNNLVNFDPSTKESKKLALRLVPFVQSIQRLT